MALVVAVMASPTSEFSRAADGCGGGDRISKIFSLMLWN